MNTASIFLALRRRTGWTQHELATQLGVSLPTINRWEKGKTEPDRLGRQALEECLRRLGDAYRDLLEALSGERTLDVELSMEPPPKTKGGRRKQAARQELAAAAYGLNGAVMDIKAMENLLWKAACSIRGEKDAP